MTTATTEPPTLASRLSDSHVGLRPDLEFSRLVFRKEVAYVVTDPMTAQRQRFSFEDYRVMMRLEPQQSLGDAFQGLVQDGILEPEDEDRFYQFVVALHKLRFLALPISDDKGLYRRYLHKQRARRAQWSMALFFLQVPIWNPDAFLDRTMHLVRPLFTRLFLGFWLGLIGLATFVVARSWDEFMAPIAETFSTGNLAILWATLIVLKVLHEFGHAYACKNFGGRVTEMGAFFIVLTPCAYVDASASWAFSRKLHRLIVSFGGVYVELTVAALAALVWSVTAPGTLNSITHNVVILGSLVTVGLNLNPLMRFDGYYAFSDMLEIPNLRQRASQYMAAFFAFVFVGVKDPTHWGSRGHRAFLLVFGILSSIYRITVVLGISAVIATKFFVAGVFLGGFYVVMEIFKKSSRLLGFLWRARGSTWIRLRGATVALMFLGALPAGLLLVPMPGRVIAPGVITTESETVIRATAAGFLEGVSVQLGQEVPAGAPLASLRAWETERDLHEAEVRVQVAEMRLRSARIESQSAAMQEQERVDADRSRVETLAEDLEKLTVRSSSHGTVVSCLDHRDLGRFLPAGTPIATVASGRAIVRTLLSEHDIASTKPEVGQVVEFRAESRPGQSLPGEITRVTPLATRNAAAQYRHQFDSGTIPVNPTTGETAYPYVELEVTLESGEEASHFSGMTGRVKLEGSPETVGAVLIRKLVLFRNRLTGNS